MDYVNRYFANYGTISELAEAYAAAQAEADAAEIYDKYKTLQGFNRVLADSLSDAWNYIFDNKSYAYGYLMDKLGRDEILSREEERLSEAARQLSELRGETASDAVTDYFLRKKVLVGYETSVADMLGLTSARDSLRGVTAQLEGIDFRLPRIDVAERYFLDYDSVSFSSTPKYSYQHPIPECKVYEHGTIYRILLGTFNTKRAVSTFRGAYPLSYLVNDDRKWCYYAGGFATREEAKAAEGPRFRPPRNRRVDRRRVPQSFEGPRSAAYRLPGRDRQLRSAFRRGEGGDYGYGRGVRAFARGTAALRRRDVRRQGRGRPRGGRGDADRPGFGNKSR